MRKVEKQRLDALSFDEAQSKYLEIVGSVAADQLRVEHQHQNRGMGVTKAQYIDANMEIMEKTGVFNTRYEKWFEALSSKHVAGRWVQTSAPPKANMYT